MDLLDISIFEIVLTKILNFNFVCAAVYWLQHCVVRQIAYGTCILAIMRLEVNYPEIELRKVKYNFHVTSLHSCCVIPHQFRSNRTIPLQRKNPNNNFSDNNNIFRKLISLLKELRNLSNYCTSLTDF